MTQRRVDPTAKLELAALIEEALRAGWRRYTLQGAQLDWVIEALRADGETATEKPDA